MKKKSKFIYLIGVIFLLGMLLLAWKLSQKTSDLQGKNQYSEEMLIEIAEWENSKNEKVPFPLYKKDVQRKLIPYLQAQLLAQYIRGDIPEYPPYIWEGD